MSIYRHDYKRNQQEDSVNIPSPRFTINVLDDDINRAIPRSSRHCMIEYAIEHDVPNASRPIVDIQTIRWTDKTKGLRYTFITPAKILALMLAWDEGHKPKPFSFRLRGAQITSSRTVVKRKGKTTTKRTHQLGRRRPVIAKGDGKKRMRPTIIGGTPPPLTRFQNNRVFGSRTLAALVGGKDLVEMLRGNLGSEIAS